MTSPFDSGEGHRPPIALQLYSVRDEFATDPAETLHRVAALGYDGVEWFGGLWDRSPGFWRVVLQQTGLSIVAAHVDLDTLERDTDQQLELWESLRCRTLVVPYLTPEQRSQEDVYHRVGERLDLVGYRLRGRGFRLAYHNHDFELRPGPTSSKGGADGILQILSHASHDSISAELDVFWLAWAGANPVDYVRQIGATPNRVRLVHLKDGLLVPEAQRPALAHEQIPYRPLGQGDVDLEGVVEAALDCGVECFVVEQDFSDGPPMEAAGKSLAWLRPRLDDELNRRRLDRPRLDRPRPRHTSAHR